MMPPDELAEWARSSIHCRLSSVGSSLSKTNRNGIDGCNQIVLRPAGSSGCRHDSVKLSLRRSLVAMTIFKCASARSSM